jgi:iron complex outermembrane receptor protein
VATNRRSVECASRFITQTLALSLGFLRLSSGSADAPASVPPSPIVATKSTDDAPGAPTDSPSAKEAGSELQQVVVTARKTEESLQRVPESVAAITGDDLEKRSLDTLSDIGQSTPNFNFGEQGNTGRGAGILFIRGVGQVNATVNFEPAVGLYIDGVFLGRPNGNDLDMLDIERVEVLRGPQGTLFGRNTSGGAVNIITKQPDASADGLSGRAEIITGSLNRFDAVVGLNIPLVTDKVALQFDGSRRSQDGYGRRTDGESTGSTDRDSGRVSLLLKPTEHFSALIEGDGTIYNETNAVEKLVDINTATGPIAAINAFTPLKYDSRWLSSSDFLSYGTGPNSSRGDLSGTSVTLNLDTDWATLKSISAYRRLNVHSDQDPDNSPVTLLNFYDYTRQHEISQELQAKGESFDERLDWVLGAYYFHESASESDLSILLTALVPDCGACFDYIRNVATDSYASYGQANYKLTERLRFTAGLRFTHDTKEFEGIDLAYPGNALLGITGTLHKSWDDMSPRLGFDYQWTPDIMTYVSAARGYKGGGFTSDAGVPATVYSPEIVWTYELGLRSDLLDHHLRFNTTAFYNNYSDLQMQINGSTTNSSGNPVPFAITANIPKVRITGGEVELIVVPAKRLQLTSGLGLTYAQYLQLPTSAAWTAANLVTLHSQFPYTPKVSLTLGAEYTMPLSGARSATGRIDYAYKSTIYYNLTDSPYLRQSPYGLLNARLTFEYQQRGLSFSVFATNLTNKHYFTGGYDDADIPTPGLGFAFVDMAPPREFGVSAQVRF